MFPIHTCFLGIITNPKTKTYAVPQEINSIIDTIIVLAVSNHYQYTFRRDLPLTPVLTSTGSGEKSVNGKSSNSRLRISGLS